MKKSLVLSKILLTLFCCTALLSAASAQRGYYPHYRSRGYYPSVHYGSSFRYGYPRYSSLPYGSLSINFGGNPYFYNSGIFYRPYGGYYRSILPPVGIHIGVLPFGYTPLFVGPDPYYFYEGTYYRRYNNDSYEVVDAPMGAQLSSLPRGAKSVVVNGEKFYEFNGTYYKEDRNAKGQVVYTVVGKNGEIDNTVQAPAPPAAPQIGDHVSQLPADCRTITLNGEKLYVSPDDTYYQAETDGSFRIVGLPGSTTL